MTGRVLIEVHGRVQGVGFRPFVYGLAHELGLRGFVQNCGSDVLIDVEGQRRCIETLIGRLRTDAPTLASIEAVTAHDAPLVNHQEFAIRRSTDTHVADVEIAPDVGTCEECRAEIFDRSDRRFRYPFTNCTNCGPRFTIIRGVPYDRGRTTMDAFPMCDACRREYEDPRDRRFHAQPIACPHCGPTLALHGPEGTIQGNDAALRAAVDALERGLIVAIKGLGGYNLACDATAEAVVVELRRRKRRETKPFAVMVPRRLADRLALAAAGVQRMTLWSHARPITLIDRGCADALHLAPSVAPGCPAVGVMLPYTPLHHLLLEEVNLPLVMTSGNCADEPIAYEDADAVERLRAVADLWLTHDRPIEMRCDDSVVAVICEAPAVIRRARGFAPDALPLAEMTPEPVLAVGAHLKNTFCLMTGAHAVLSPHIGDLDTVAGYEALAHMVEHYTRVFDTVPRVVVHDAHPDYLSTRFAAEYPVERRIAVQHHHAHVLSCAAEHRHAGPVLGVAFDGAGLGTDRAIWGGEFLIVDGAEWTRAAHLAYVPLLGGDRAAREGWRMALAHGIAAFGREGEPVVARLLQRRSIQHADFLRQICDRGIAPPTSSIGRLFDAVAALLGLCDASRFEGEAALLLEAQAPAMSDRPYEFGLDTSATPWTIDAAPVIRSIVSDLGAGVDVPRIASAFHSSVAEMIGEIASRLARATGIHDVALTGGVFQNRVLTERASLALEARRLHVLRHQRVPSNDGGLSLGQAVGAARLLGCQRGRSSCVSASLAR